MLAAAKAGKKDGFGLVGGSATIAPTDHCAEPVGSPPGKKLTRVGLWYRIKTVFTNI
jgi:hypothetical protein